jgi:hypothetical protein
VWTANKCLKLRRFTQFPCEKGQEGYEDMFEPCALGGILRWITKTCVPNVPAVDVIYNQEIFFAGSMQKTSLFFPGTA